MDSLQSKSEYTIEFVFRRLSPVTRIALKEFWAENRNDWLATTREPSVNTAVSMCEEPSQKPRRQLRHVACIAYNTSGEIAGIAWMKAAFMALTPGQPELIYFQRMYIKPEHRCFRLAYHLYDTFLRNLKSSDKRSPLIRFLVAQNVNPKLKTPAGRLLFIRRGFEFMGFNSHRNELWRLPLAAVQSDQSKQTMTPDPQASLTQSFGSRPG